jgi:hypothetical protein
MAEKMSPLKWVERLLEPSRDETLMTQAAQVLLQSHYNDVVDERNISHLCGYPVCKNPLGKQPQQRYHISLAKKKVFDLTERKKFCCSECFRASKYYASQLSTLPLQARDGSVAIKLLPLADSREAPKEQVASGVMCAPPSSTTSSAGQGNTLPMSTIKENVVSKEALTALDTGMGMLELDNEDGVTHQQTPVNPPKLSPVSRLLHAMSSWCTSDTWQLLTRIRHGTEVDSKGTSSGNSQCGVTVHKDIVHGGHRSARFEQGKSCEHDATARTVEADHDRSTRVREEGEGGSSLPPVHSSAHSQLQMTIFIQQLKRNFPSVAVQLNLSLLEALPRIMPLVRTFSFSRHTVTFKPAEWKVIIFVLLQTVNPDWELNTVHSVLVQDWLKGVNASDNDLKLMLNIFELSD